MRLDNLEYVALVAVILVVKLYLKLKVVSVFLKFMVVCCAIVGRYLGVFFLCFVSVLFLFLGNPDTRHTYLTV